MTLKLQLRSLQIFFFIYISQPYELPERALFQDSFAGVVSIVVANMVPMSKIYPLGYWKERHRVLTCLLMPEGNGL